MKLLILAFALLLGTSFQQSFAEDSSKFQTVKGRLIKRIDERIALFQKLRECLDNGATTKELKQCSDKYALEAKKQSNSFKTDRKKLNK